MVLVNADFHTHSSDDREDTFIKYSSKDLIDAASKHEIKILAITLHAYILPSKKFEEYKLYAKKKGVLLIQGVEATIKGKHVLIYNITDNELKKIKSFDDLRTARNKNKNIFVIAPHPFMPKNFLSKFCLQEDYFKNKDLFDALEYQMFHFPIFNPNKKTEKIGFEDNKPVLANSDSHFLNFFGKNYSIIDVKGEINEKNIFTAIKQNRVKIHSNTTTYTFIKIIFHTIRGEIIKLFLKTKF